MVGSSSPDLRVSTTTEYCKLRHCNPPRAPQDGPQHPSLHKQVPPHTKLPLQPCMACMGKAVAPFTVTTAMYISPVAPVELWLRIGWMDGIARPARTLKRRCWMPSTLTLTLTLTLTPITDRDKASRPPFRPRRRLGHLGLASGTVTDERRPSSQWTRCPCWPSRTWSRYDSRRHPVIERPKTNTA